MKKIIGVVFLCLCMLCFFPGCKEYEKDSQTLGKDTSIYKNGLLTSANLLSNHSSNKRISTSISKNDLEKVDEYFQTLCCLVNENGPILISETESDNDAYQVKLIFEYTDLSFNKTTYTLYLNKNEIRDDEDIFENEKEYIINGIALIDGITYNLTGKHEIEDDESELELCIKLDSDNYVIIEEENETFEKEYSYKIYKDGKLYQKFSMENENNELEIKFDNGSDSIKIENKVLKNNEYLITYKLNNIKCSITVNEIDKDGSKYLQYQVKGFSEIFEFPKK